MSKATPREEALRLLTTSRNMTQEAELRIDRDNCREAIHAISEADFHLGQSLGIAETAGVKSDKSYKERLEVTRKYLHNMKNRVAGACKR